MSVNQLKSKIDALNVQMREQEQTFKRQLKAKDLEIKSLTNLATTAATRYNTEVLGVDNDGKVVDVLPQGGYRKALELALKEIAKLQNPDGTPANRHPEGEDPFVSYLALERAELALGDWTDDALANAVYTHGNENVRMEDVIAGRAMMPIVYLTAAKERIRWLSRKLLEAAKSNTDVVKT